MQLRPITHADVPQACALLNQIIDIGGTTAFEVPFDQAGFAAAYVDGADLICCNVALDQNGAVAGFQWLGRNPRLPADCADIASFARRSNPVKGIGRAMFPVTCDAARAAGFAQINATIRADNTPGLGYYSAMGFVDHHVARAVPLNDGTPVDRISKRFVL